MKLNYVNGDGFDPPLLVVSCSDEEECKGSESSGDPYESSGDPRQCQAMVEFLEFIYIQSLVDIPFVGGILVGLIINIMRHDLELIGSCYLQIGKNIFWMYLRYTFLDFC